MLIQQYSFMGQKSNFVDFLALVCYCFGGGVNMESIFRIHKSGNYSIISNHHLINPQLSFKAKGLHTYILSKPDNWKVVIADLIASSTDGRDSVYAAIKELTEQRYWNKYPVRENKKIAYYQTDIYEFPIDDGDLIIKALKDVESITIYRKNGLVERKELLTEKP